MLTQEKNLREMSRKPPRNKGERKEAAAQTVPRQWARRADPSRAPMGARGPRVRSSVPPAAELPASAALSAHAAVHSKEIRRRIQSLGLSRGKPGHAAGPSARRFHERPREMHHKQ